MNAPIEEDETVEEWPVCYECGREARPEGIWQHHVPCPAGD